MAETITQKSIRHSKSATIVGGVLYFVAQFFGIENPLEQLDRLELNQQVIMQRLQVHPAQLPEDTSIDDLMDAMDLMRRMNRAPRQESY